MDAWTGRASRFWHEDRKSVLKFVTNDEEKLPNAGHPVWTKIRGRATDYAPERQIAARATKNRRRTSDYWPDRQGATAETKVRGPARPGVGGGGCDGEVRFADCVGD
jgi:hypothetical protein